MHSRKPHSLKAPGSTHEKPLRIWVGKRVLVLCEIRMDPQNKPEERDTHVDTAEHSSATEGSAGTDDDHRDQQLKQHYLRSYTGRSMKCPSCAKIGPSPQTGLRECEWCRLCESCLLDDRVGHPHCLIGGMIEDNVQSKSTADTHVSWQADGALFELQVSPMKPGLVYFTTNSSERVPSWRVVFAHDPIPHLKIGNQRSERVADLPLPQHHTTLSKLLPDIVLLLNLSGVSHEVPWHIDDDFHALPRVFGPFSQSRAVDIIVTPRGDYVFTAHADFTVRMCSSTGNGALIWTRFRSAHSPFESRFESPHQVLDLSPCLKRLLVCGWPGLLVSAASGTTIAELHPEGDDTCRIIHCGTFSPCGRYLGCAFEGSTVTVFEGSIGRPMTTLPSELFSIVPGLWCMAFSASGGFLVFSADNDRHFGICVITGWRVGTPLVSIHLDDNNTKRICSVQFSADDSRLLSASLNGVILIYSVCSDGKLVVSQRLQHPHLKQSLCRALFTENGKYVVSLTSEGTLWYWKNSQLHAVYKPSFHGNHLSMDSAPRGRLAITVAEGFLITGSPYNCFSRLQAFNSAVSRSVHQHCGQAALLSFLKWQNRLAGSCESLPSGVVIVRQLPKPLLSRVSTFLPNPTAGDFVDKQRPSNCSLM
ncbi:hypothetical protein DIPPA_64552 [Diplonema papillatum]|nr:hypothetical protein DIPPA_64552 [Diplonema papillatum]